MKTEEPVPEGGRACGHCGDVLPPDAHMKQRYCSEDCLRVVKAAHVRKWRANNPAKLQEQNRRAWENIPPERKAGYVAKAKTVRLRDVRATILNGARARAKKGNLPFNITVDDIVIPDTCPVLGIDIVLGSGQAVDGSPSLDKIIPKLGYVVGNVEIISWRANALKRDATVQEMRRLADYYEKKISSGGWMVPPAG